MANKKYGNKDELSITLYLQSEINFCSVRIPVATSFLSLFIHNFYLNILIKKNTFKRVW